MSTKPTNLLLPGQPDPRMDPAFKLTGAPAITGFNFTGVDPPSALYIQRDDQLFIFAFSSLSGEVINITGALLLSPVPTGGQPDTMSPGRASPRLSSSNTIEPVAGQVRLPTAYIAGTTTIQLAEGYLLRLGVTCTQSPVRGRTFVRCVIVRGGSAILFSTVVLLEDFVSVNGPIGWPGGRSIAATEGPGWKHALQVANPAGGADWSLLMNGVQRMRIESFNAVFTASGVAGNRNIQIIVDDGANVMGVFTVPTVVIATNVANVTGTAGNINTPLIPLNELVPLPTPLILEPAWRLRASTVGILAGDQWSAIWLNVEEWIEAL